MRKALMVDGRRKNNMRKALKKENSWHLLLLAIAMMIQRASGYAHIPELNRKYIAGVWRLTSEKSLLPKSKEEKRVMEFPIKEFTVYPKKKTLTLTSQEEDTLLMLNEDGSFTQYGKIGLASDEEDEEEDDSPPKKTEEDSNMNGIALLKGTWDYLDGKLILAADRPTDADPGQVHDTVLSGRVVATSQESLPENPADETTSTEDIDVRLTVPEGSVKIGRFMYPKRHPSFFDQPICRPTKTGSFQLRQVLGKLNTSVKEEKPELLELFKRQDFVGKRFLLTSQPIPTYRPKGKLRWSKPEGRYVEDNPQPADPGPIDIRVMQIEFFSNYTFTTVGPSTSQKTLRGKWNIIGNDRDQLWFQVWRFGFGRSVRGSTFSEGKGLTQDDARSYWGTIQEVNATDTTNDITTDKRKIEVSGSVLFGWGLEPQPIGIFTMIETEDDDEEDDLDDDIESDMDDDVDDDINDGDDDLFDEDMEGAFQ